MNEPDASELWDRWQSARADDPDLALEAFVQRIGGDAEMLELLRTLDALERSAEPSSLVDVSSTREGTTFAGFRIVRSLGQGSAGVVFLVTSASEGPTGRLLALKVLNPLLAASPERRATILHEARIAARLDHPGIVRVIASGIERGYAWIATDWVEGEQLGKHVVAQSERTAFAIDVGLQLASALGHAHSRGVVHRDLKPANVIVSTSGAIRILDFGLARAEGTTFAVSRTGEAIGTPLYMAPEQWRGERDVGAWTDVFAVGLMLAEISTGRALSAEDGVAATLRRIASNKRRLSRADLRQIEPGLRDVVSRCIEPHPSDRYQDCAALERDLQAVRKGETLETGAQSGIVRFGRSCARHPLRCLMIAALVLLIARGSAYVWHTWPVPCVSEEVRGGKIVWIDGEEQSTSGFTVWLRPGEHRWSARAGNSDHDYSGTFVVRPHEPRFLNLILDAPYGHEEMPELSQPSSGPRACVTVDTNLDQMTLVIDTVAHELNTGMATFFLPLGDHEISLEAEGRQRINRKIHIEDQELFALGFEPDRADSDWSTTLLYSPIDHDVKQSVRSIDGLRLFFEKTQVSRQTPLAVSRAYWGPSKSYKPGTVWMAVDLGVEVHELEVEICSNMLVSVLNGWSTIDMGPDEQHMTRMRGYGTQAEPGQAWVHRDDLSESTFERPTAEHLGELVRGMQGRRELWVCLRAGGVPAGGNDSTGAQVLRSHALPMRLPTGELVWCPALRVRAR